MALRLRQGLAADRTSITPATGELIYTTDTKFVYVGDGTTPGGNIISGAVATNLDGLSDVVITSASNGQVLKFNGTNWINDTVAGGSSNLDGLTDVVITAASNGQVLKYNGTNWVNAAEAAGSSFAVSGDDSVPFTINSGDTLSILGDGRTNVYFDGFNNLTVQTPTQVEFGVAGQIPFYGATGEVVTPAGTGILFDINTGLLFADNLNTNRIESDSASFAIFPKGAGNTIGLGGNLNGTEYSGRLFQVDLGPVDVNAPFSVAFRNIHNFVNVNAILLERSRGTLAAQTAVQAGDVLHAIIFSGNTGTSQYPAAQIAALCESTPSAGVMPGILAFQTTDTTGAVTTACYIDSAQYHNYTGTIRDSVQNVNTSASDATLTRAQLRGNIIFTSPAITTRTLTLPQASASTAGLRILVVNSSGSQSLNIASTGGGTFKTITAGTYANVVCTGTVWFSL